MQKNVIGLPRCAIIFDTEYTAWEGSMQRGWNGKKEYREIIQIAAIRAHCGTFTEEDSFNIFVTPVKNPKLSEFIINLTGITQKDINKKGMGLKHALEKFLKWSQHYPLYSFGIDADVMKENCKLIGIPFPFQKKRFGNLRPLFKKFGIEEKKFTSGTILHAFGKEISRRPHDALNDVRTLLEGLCALNKKIKVKNITKKT